jgi:serine/threonine-protein kinase
VAVSPSGQWVAYIEGVNTLKRVAVSGGSPNTVVTTDGFSRGVAWSSDDSIVFSTINRVTGLQRVGVGGGEVSVLTRPEAARGESDHLWPESLPNGRGVLFTITALQGGLDAAQVAVLDLVSGNWTTVVRGGHHAHYVSSGHLVYMSGNTLRAVPFDLERLVTRGAPITVTPRVMTTVEGGAYLGVANNGTLVYVESPKAGAQQRTLTWVDRQGHETPLAAPPRQYMHPRLSADGTRVAVTVIREGQPLPSVWIWDLSRSTLRLVTHGAGGGNAPVWLGDDRVAFNVVAGTGTNVYAQAANGSGGPEPLAEGRSGAWPTGASPDRSALIFAEESAGSYDLWMLPVATSHPATQGASSDGGNTLQAQRLLETRSNERNGVVSRDARWLAYESDVSGQLEIYVSPFPNVKDGQSLVSNGGGRQPLWAHTRRELFYLAPDGSLMSVSVEARGTAWAAGTPKKLLEGRYFTGGGIAGDPARHYDVSLDDMRFLMMKDVDTGAPPQIMVVQNWAEELKRLAPTN